MKSAFSLDKLGFTQPNLFNGLSYEQQIMYLISLGQIIESRQNLNRITIQPDYDNSEVLCILRLPIDVEASNTPLWQAVNEYLANPAPVKYPLNRMGGNGDTFDTAYFWGDYDTAFDDNFTFEEKNRYYSFNPLVPYNFVFTPLNMGLIVYDGFGEQVLNISQGETQSYETSEYFFLLPYTNDGSVTAMPVVHIIGS